MRFRVNATINGSVISATIPIHTTSNSISCPYWVNIPIPLSETEVKTSPITPIGANCIIPLTIMVRAFAKSSIIFFVLSLATILRAIPNTKDQNRIPRYSPSVNDFIGFEKIVVSMFVRISSRPLGADTLLAAVRCIPTGKRWLPKTATIAAMKVLKR